MFGKFIEDMMRDVHPNFSNIPAMLTDSRKTPNCRRRHTLSIFPMHGYYQKPCHVT